MCEAFRKYSDPFTCFLSSIYTQYPIMTKEKQVFRHFCKFIKNETLKCNIYIRFQNLYSVHLGAITVITPVFGEFLPFFSADPHKLCQVGWECRCTAIFRSLQRCSIGFKYGFWLGHSRTFRDLSQRHYCVALAVCLGSLSCRKVNLHPSLRS